MLSKEPGRFGERLMALARVALSSHTRRSNFCFASKHRAGIVWSAYTTTARSHCRAHGPARQLTQTTRKAVKMGGNEASDSTPRTLTSISFP
jgi:hypothetical protein